MHYQTVIPAVFLARPNRFIAQVEVDGRPEIAHVKNTGRCKELLVPGCRVFLSVSGNPDRKTKYDLIAAEKQRPGKAPLLVNLDSQAPNDTADEWLKTGALFGPDVRIRREVTHGDSRFDFYLEVGSRKIFLEVKGCTLESGGEARFPDAPTERGVKHVSELAACLDEGYEAFILIVIQMKDVHSFRPNDETHRAFGDALRAAAEKGVQVLAVDCIVTPDTMVIDKPVPVCLERPGFRKNTL